MSRPRATFALLAAWPAALAAQLLVIIAGAAIAYLLISQSLPDTGRDLSQISPGFGDKVQTETDLDGLLAARTSADAQNDFSALMAATAAGLRHPPPGAARGSYVAALTDFRTAGLDLRDNQVSAALVATQNGIDADQKATTMLTAQLGQCRR